MPRTISSWQAGCLACDSQSRWTNVGLSAVLFVALPFLVVCVGCCTYARHRARTRDGSSASRARGASPERLATAAGRLSSPSVAGGRVSVGGRRASEWRQSVATTAEISKALPAELRVRWTVKSRVLLSMLQILSLLSAAFNIRWPSSYASLLGDVDTVVNLNPLGLLSLSCIDPSYNWHSTLLQTTLLPIALIGLLLLLRTCAKRGTCGAPADSAEEREGDGVGGNEHWLASGSATAVTALLLLVFPRTTSTIFAAFNCEMFDAGVDAHGQTIWLHYLSADLSIDCATETHRAYQLYALVMLAVYPFGVPACLGFVMWRSRRSMREIREELAARDSGRLSDINGTLVRAMRAKLGAYAWLKPVVSGYKPHFFWFEVLECFRKVALVGLLVPVGNEGFAQLVVGSLLAAGLLCVICATRPYLLATDNILAVCCQGTIFVTLQLALYLRLVQLEVSVARDEAHTRGADADAERIAAEGVAITSSVSLLLIALGAVPIGLALLLALYEAPRAWKTAKQRWRKVQFGGVGGLMGALRRGGSSGSTLRRSSGGEDRLSFLHDRFSPRATALRRQQVEARQGVTQQGGARGMADSRAEVSGRELRIRKPLPPSPRICHSWASERTDSAVATPAPSPNSSSLAPRGSGSTSAHAAGHSPGTKRWQQPPSQAGPAAGIALSPPHTRATGGGAVTSPVSQRASSLISSNI